MAERSGRARGWRRWWPVAAWAAVLFLQSSIPAKDIPIVVPIVGWDKLVHFVLYGTLAWLAMRGRQDGRPAVWIILLFCVVYGASDEAHQFLVPGRTPSVWDLLADSIGAGLGILLFLRLPRRGRGRGETTSN